MRKPVRENHFKVDFRVVPKVVAINFLCLYPSQTLCTKFDDFFNS